MKNSTYWSIVLFLLGMMEGMAVLALVARESAVAANFAFWTRYVVLMLDCAAVVAFMLLIRKRLVSPDAAAGSLPVLSVLMVRTHEERRAGHREHMARLTHGMGLLMLILLAMIAFGGIASAAAATNGADVGGMVGVFIGGFLLFGMLAAIIWAAAKATRHIRLLHMHVLDARKGGAHKHRFGRRRREERE